MMAIPICVSSDLVLTCKLQNAASSEGQRVTPRPLHDTCGNQSDHAGTEACCEESIGAEVWVVTQNRPLDWAVDADLLTTHRVQRVAGNLWSF